MSDCTCFVVENPWRFNGIVEPGGAMEPNPECPVHFPEYDGLVRDDLSEIVLAHFTPNEFGDWRLRPLDAADAILAKFGVIPLDGVERTERIAGGFIFENPERPGDEAYAHVNNGVMRCEAATDVKDYGRGNAEFIAAVNPGVVLALLAELDAVEAELQEAERAYDLTQGDLNDLSISMARCGLKSIPDESQGDRLWRGLMEAKNLARWFAAEAQYRKRVARVLVTGAEVEATELEVCTTCNGSGSTRKPERRVPPANTPLAGLNFYAGGECPNCEGLGAS